jgi:hypothetical protein
MKEFLRLFFPVSHLNFDILLPFELPTKLLKWFGMWITKESTRRYIIFCAILHFFIIDLTFLCGLFYLLYLKDILDFVNVMTLLPVIIDVEIESIIVFFSMDKILGLMDLIRECSREYGVGDSYKKALQTVDKAFKLFFVGALQTILSFSLFGIISQELICMIWTPYDLDDSLNFWLTLTYQIIVTVVTTFWNISFLYLPPIFMTYIIGMLMELCERLERIQFEPLFNTDGVLNLKWKNNRFELIKCIEYKLKIHEVTKKFVSTFTLVFVLRGFLAAELFATTVFSMIMISDVLILGKLLVYFVLTLISIFVPCFCGSKITELSERIGQIITGSEWMYEDKEYKKLVIIALENAKRPIKITALGLFDVDLKTFKSICESTYSMFCIFKKAMEK